MASDLEYEDSTEDGEPITPKWGGKRKKGKSASTQAKVLVINSDDPAYFKYQGYHADITVILEKFAVATFRTYWHSEDERNSFLRGIKKNAKREYGKEWLEWLLWCCENLKPTKGWTLDRVVQYLNSEDRYVSKLGILKMQRDTKEGKTMNLKKGGSHALTAQDFLDEIAQSEPDRLVDDTQ